MVLALPFIFIAFSAHAERAQIVGDYCYQYGDSETLVAAKEISYAMALRKAIETYGTFVTSTSVVKDYQLRKDLVETIASGYIENIKITKQNITGRTVCTELVGYVNSTAVKTIISKKIKKHYNRDDKSFGGIVSNRYIKILNYKKEGKNLVLLTQVKSNEHVITDIIIDCFDNDGNPVPGRSLSILLGDPGYYVGLVQRRLISLPKDAASFEIRLRSRRY